MSKIAIIGTAGRDKTKPMTLALWVWMVQDAMQRVGKGDHLVSGGAAWADHLAVTMFLAERVKALTLHLPAPLGLQGFNGPNKSSATAANYYHSLFTNVIGEYSFGQIKQCEDMPGCDGTFEPEAPGYAAMFARNRRVAEAADLMLAYTFAEGDQPADGGTKHTWDMCRGKRIHITLPKLP